MTDVATDLEIRALLVPPTTRDGEITQSLLLREGIACVVCPNIQQLTKELASGAGALILTEESLAENGIGELLAALNAQPPWSDLPIVLLMPGGGQSVAAGRVLNALRNVTLLERPAPMRSLVSAVQAAVRGRQRQYQTRQQLEALSRAEARSRDLQQQLEVAVDASELGTFHCQMPLGKIIWNDRCKEHFWLTPDAQIDFDLFYSIIHPDDRQRTRQAVEACVFGHESYDIEYRTVSPQGAIRWVRATGRTFYNEKQEPVRFDGTTQDITQRKHAQDELRKSQEQFQAMANSIPQLAWMARPDGWIFWYNQRWHEYCGTTARQMEGWGWEKVQDPKEFPRVVEKWKAALATGSAWEDTFPLRRHDGQFRWHLSRAMPFKDSAGNIVLWFGTNTDITEERTRAQEREQLLQSERAARADAEKAGRMKDEFLATLSHELRTPLNAILGWSQLIHRDPDKQTLDEGLSVIERNARVQVQLIEDLLDMSRIISGKVRLNVQPVEANSFIEAAIETVAPAAEAKGIRIDKILTHAAVPLSGDPARLQQVIWNLLSNAIKFTPKGGRVQVLLERRNSQLEISVADTGRGIKSEFLPHVFERFRQADSTTTRAHGGLGLGLAIVKHLVELHGGTIQAKSPGEGQGSTFTVSLPVSVVHRGTQTERRLATREPEPINCEHTSLEGIKVLVLDDEPDARELLRRVLEECDARVFTASSAAQALQLVEQETPDVLVSDIGMPQIDGYEFLKQVRSLGARRGGNIPAIALTAFARSEDRTRALLAGYIVHVSKPVEPQELIATVASVAGRTGVKREA